MKFDPDFQDAFKDGFADPEGKNPYMSSSNMFEARELGRLYGRTGRPADRVSKGRGYDWNTERGLRWSFKYSKAHGTEIVRIS